MLADSFGLEGGREVGRGRDGQTEEGGREGGREREREGGMERERREGGMDERERETGMDRNSLAQSPVNCLPFSKCVLLALK